MTKTQDELLAAVISDEEIIRVHGRANFGTMSPREVVNDGVWKSAVGYHCGHTQFSILREHGLITKPRGMSYDVNLTKKGKRYARLILAALRSPDPEVERLRGALEAFVNGIERAPISWETGVCCCGNAVDGHGFGDGHSPVDEGVYFVTGLLTDARAAYSSNIGGR